MPKTILDAFEEAFDKIIVEDAVSELKAVKTAMPRKIFNLMGHFEKNGEFELYEFLDRCVFYKVPRETAPPPPIWFQTAAVSARSERVEFFYDEDFIEGMKNYNQLALLIAHEASHIFRLHQDITEMEKLDPSQFNIAADMIINHDILKTPKLGQYEPQALTEKDPKTGKEKRVGCYLDQIDFEKDVAEKEGKKSYHGRRVYDYLSKQGQKKPQQGQPEDYYKEGGIVRVKSTGEYKRITGKTKDGKLKTEPVDIDKVIEDAKAMQGGGAESE